MGGAALLNLKEIGVSIAKPQKSLSKSLFGGKKRKKTRRSDDVPYELSRYQPHLRTILEELVKDELPADAYPFYDTRKVQPGAGSSSASEERRSTKKPSWGAGKKGKEETVTGPRVIVFVAGGVTFSETRAAHEVANANKRDILVGSTHVWTPNKFLRAMANLRQGAGGGRKGGRGGDDEEDDGDV
eukprot:tig00021438_g21451.t1